jgi:hypothetical protein
MSLTTFLALPEIKGRLKLEYKLPIIGCEHDIKVESRTAHPMLIGTAFDYLFRFWLETFNPSIQTNPWVAEDSLSLEMVGATASVKRKIKRLLQESRASHAEYVKTGELTDSIINTAIILAQLDAIHRANYLDPCLGQIEKPMVEELRDLLNLANKKDFTAKTYCILNPTFGYGSRVVGGADADLIIDDTLIDIKTTKIGKMNRSYFNQLIGYFILNELGTVNRKQIKINRLGIYFSRYGELVTLSSDQIVNEGFPCLVEWFRSKAEGKDPPEGTLTAIRFKEFYGQKVNAEIG